MATLCLGSIDRSAPLLRDWVGEDWGLLFSHPMDFQDQGPEFDRWLTLLRTEFRASHVRPLACRRPFGDADASWVGELMRDQGLIRLDDQDDGHAAAERTIDHAANSLRDIILSQTTRYVLIIDPLLHCHGILHYHEGFTSVSPLDLAVTVEALRRGTGRSHRRRPEARMRDVA